MLQSFLLLFWKLFCLNDKKHLWITCIASAVCANEKRKRGRRRRRKGGEKKTHTSPFPPRFISFFLFIFFLQWDSTLFVCVLCSLFSRFFFLFKREMAACRHSDVLLFFLSFWLVAFVFLCCNLVSCFFFGVFCFCFLLLKEWDT